MLPGELHTCACGETLLSLCLSSGWDGGGPTGGEGIERPASGLACSASQALLRILAVREHHYKKMHHPWYLTLS